MDDIRRPDSQRRDFAMRNRAYAPRPASSQPIQPVQEQPVALPIASPAAVPAQSVPAAPTVALPQTIPQPAPTPYEQPYSHYTQPASKPVQKAGGRNPLKALPLKYVASSVVIVVLLAAAGFMVTRPPKKSGFTVAELNKKADFGFFYPQPLPAGYVYQPKFNAVQDGQVYFMLANGGKHLFIREQAAGGKLDLTGLSSVQKISAAGGQAAVGTQAGQPAAKARLGSTVISVNSTGGVPQDELVKVINLLKYDR